MLNNVGGDNVAIVYGNGVDAPPTVASATQTTAAPATTTATPTFSGTFK